MQSASAEALLRQATASADDVQDPPEGTWLVLRWVDGMQASPGIPPAFPDVARLDEVTRTRKTQTTTVRAGTEQYLARTAAHGDSTVQAVLDVGPQHDQRSDLTHILLEVGAVGLILSTFVGTFMARRAVVIEVTDTGAGIAAAHIDRVFDRFHSSHQKASRRSYGLGLSLARAVVTRHGGRIGVESTVDVGTTFRISVPHG